MNSSNDFLLSFLYFIIYSYHFVQITSYAELGFLYK